MNLRLFLLPAMALTLFAGSVFAACGGDDDDDDNGGSDTRDEATNTRRAGNDDDKATPTTASNDDDDDDDNGGDGELTGSGADELRELARDLSDKEFSVTYKWSGDEELGFTEMTMAQKPPKTATMIKSDEGDIQLIDDGESSYFCSSGQAGEEGSCLESGAGGLGGGFTLDTILADLEENVEVKQVDGRKIAGRDAKCFEVTTSDGTSLACFDEDDGIMLFVEGESEGTLYSLEATDVKTKVDDSLFEPPYPVQSLTGD